MVFKAVCGVDGGTPGDGMGCSLSDCTLIDESDKLTALPLWEIPHFKAVSHNDRRQIQQGQLLTAPELWEIPHFQARFP